MYKHLWGIDREISYLSWGSRKGQDSRAMYRAAHKRRCLSCFPDRSVRIRFGLGREYHLTGGTALNTLRLRRVVNSYLEMDEAESSKQELGTGPMSPSKGLWTWI